MDIALAFTIGAGLSLGVLFTMVTLFIIGTLVMAINISRLVVKLHKQKKE